MRLLIISLLFTFATALIWEDYLHQFPNIDIFPDSEYHFLENIKYIRQHRHNFTLGITQFSHLSKEQFSRRFYNITNSENRNERSILLNLRAPENKDWVSDGAVTSVKDQGQCGSCWSFSTTGGLEGAWFIKTGKLVSLSEQQFVDCSKTNMGCNGGMVDRAFKYVERHEICSENEYLYTARDGKCYECDGIIPKLNSYIDVPKGDEEQLKNALLLNPISVAIEADSKEFQLYKGGIMDFNCGNNLDHAVLLVGFGAENGVDYWKLKNSWSTTWGEDGYFRLKRGINMCGLANCASYPIF